ncbi:MAG: hypothetical protein R2751_05850 [Bacteroidales bacterium]
MKRNDFLILLVLLGLTLPQTGALAQPYEHAIGIRAGYGSGITYKGFARHRLSALEVNALYHEHGFGASGLFVHHVEPTRKDRWLIGLGAGPLVGNWEGDLSLGLTAVAGLYYEVLRLPLEFGLDWRPMLNAYRQFDTEFLDFGFVIRYSFRL